MLSERDGVDRGSPLPGVGKKLNMLVVRDYTSQCMPYDWIRLIVLQVGAYVIKSERCRPAEDSIESQQVKVENAAR
jgi:hypothetical protein